jgi:hypothetical protein
MVTRHVAEHPAFGVAARTQTREHPNAHAAPTPFVAAEQCKSFTFAAHQRTASASWLRGKHTPAAAGTHRITSIVGTPHQSPFSARRPPLVRTASLLSAPRLPPPAARSGEAASTVFGGGRRRAAREAGEHRRVGAPLLRIWHAALRWEGGLDDFHFGVSRPGQAEAEALFERDGHDAFVEAL